MSYDIGFLCLGTFIQGICDYAFPLAISLRERTVFSLAVETVYTGIKSDLLGWYRRLNRTATIGIVF